MRRPHLRAVVALARVAVGCCVALLAFLLGAGSAAADIVVEPDQVDPGARDVTLVFRMTGEDPASRPVRLQVFLPLGRPLVGVSAAAPPGWSAQLTTSQLRGPAPTADGPVTEAVSMIDWTATDSPTGDSPTGDSPTGDSPTGDPPTGDPPPGDAVDLPVQVALMPDGAGPVRFRALQTDEAGRTVEWSNTWADNGPPPAHDELVVRLGAAPPPPAVVGTHGDHHGDEAAAVAAAPPGPAGRGALVATLGGLAAFAAAVGALVTGLGRRQRERFDAAYRRDNEPVS